MGRRIAVGLGVIACLCAFAAPAAADTATFGSNLQGSHNLSLLTSDGAMNLATTTGARLTAPATGVIGSWAVRSGDMNSVYKIAVLEPRPAGGWSVLSITSAPASVPDSNDAVRTYSASILVDAGDAIALENASPSLPIHQSGNPGDVMGRFTSPFVVGNTFPAPTTSTGREVLLQATESYCAVPDVRSQKLAAASQLLSTHDCTASVKKKKVKKKRKKNKVLAQSPAAGTTLPPGSAVELTVGKLKKPKK
jgi:hypothetical protein